MSASRAARRSRPVTGSLVARPAVIQLPAVHQLAIRVVKKKVRRALSVVRTCHILRLVVQIRKRESELLRHLGQLLGPVLRRRGYVVRADRDDSHSAAGIVAAQPGKLFLYVLHERAMPAEEHHQQPFVSGRDLSRHHSPCDHIGEAEIGRRAAQWLHRRRGADHHGLLLKRRGFRVV